MGLIDLYAFLRDISMLCRCEDVGMEVGWE